MANPFSKARLKKKYDEYRKAVKAGKMSKEEFAKQGKIMAASYQANKGKTKPAPKAKPADSKPAAKAQPAPKQTTKAKTNSSSSGTKGQFRKVGDPGPNVTKPYGQLDRSGARVRRNQEDARRSRTNASAEVRAASGSKRRNNAAIKAEVDRNSGGSRESQRAKERRQRRARGAAARRNRLNLISRRNNDM